MARRAFILGSCVTRDTFEFPDPTRYTLAAYVARQPWASVKHPAGQVVDLQAIESPFERRLVSGALDGDAVRRLASAAPYCRTLRSALGADHLLGTKLAVQADPAHKWGLAPFHYADDVYRGLVAQIDDAAARWGP